MGADRPVAHAVGGDGARIAFDRPGGRRPVWLMGHGVGSSARFLHETFGVPAAAVGLELVTWQLRGHGASTPVRDPSRHGLDHHVADLAAVAARVGPAVVGGVSLGAHAAVAATARGLVRCRAVVACLPAWTGRAAPGHGVHAAVADRIRRSGVSAVRAAFPDDPALRPWLRDVLVRDWAAHDEDSLRAALLALDGGLAPTGRELAALPVPLAVVAWDDDPGHPTAVAREWVAVADRAHLETTTIAAPDRDRTAIGRAAVAALAALGSAGPV